MGVLSPAFKKKKEGQNDHLISTVSLVPLKIVWQIGIFLGDVL